MGGAGWVVALLLSATPGAERNDTPAWNAKGAAAYLDGQIEWWSTWPNAKRDHDTFCVSCHTVAPYVLARPALADRAEGNRAGAAGGQAV